MALPPLTLIGNFGKPHGIAGEIAAVADVDISELRCIFVDIDGIMVPFFIDSVRPKNRDTVLLKIDGYDDEKQVKTFANKDIYALSAEVEIDDDDGDEEGFYASDFIGYTAVEPDGTILGTIDDIDDNTANVLFIISRPDRDKPLFVPVADEFITDIDTDSRRLTLDLPQGIIDLNG